VAAVAAVALGVLVALVVLGPVGAVVAVVLMDQVEHPHQVAGVAAGSNQVVQLSLVLVEEAQYSSLEEEERAMLREGCLERDRLAVLAVMAALEPARAAALEAPLRAAAVVLEPEVLEC